MTPEWDKVPPATDEQIAAIVERETTVSEPKRPRIWPSSHEFAALINRIKSTPSTQPPDVSKSAPEIDTLKAKLSEVTAERDDWRKLARSQEAEVFGSRQQRDDADKRVAELEAQLAKVTADEARAWEAHETAISALSHEMHRAEQAEATVAALVKVIDTAGHLLGQGSYAALSDALCGAMPNLPAAAERFLAAQRVAEACDAFRKGDAPRVLERISERKRLADAIDEALDAWRKAGQ